MSSSENSPPPSKAEERSSGEPARRASHVSVDPKLSSEDDAAVLAKLGYKQELRRNFTMIEVFGIAFSIMVGPP